MVIKYLNTHPMASIEIKEFLKAKGYENVQQIYLACKCTGVNNANKICEKYGFYKAFKPNYYSETGNKKDLELLKDNEIIVSPSTHSDIKFGLNRD